MLTIPKTLYEDIIAHCRSRYPKEACGVLAAEARSESGLASALRAHGSPGGAPGEVVVHVYPMTNVEDSPIGYSLNPAEQLAVEKQMRQRGQRMIGIYHSHTASEAYPSSVDVSLAISSDVSYALISLKNRNRPEFKSYRIDGATVSLEEVVIGQSPRV